MLANKKDIINGIEGRSKPYGIPWIYHMLKAVTIYKGHDSDLYLLVIFFWRMEYFQEGDPP